MKIIKYNQIISRLKHTNLLSTLKDVPAENLSKRQSLIFNLLSSFAITVSYADRFGETSFIIFE